MNIETWFYYSLAVLILTASPGPSVLLCMTKAVTEGFRNSMFTALGSLTAIVSIMTLSFSGLGVVIATSEVAFNIIKWSGAIYLIYLGYKSFASKQETYKISEQEKTMSVVTKKSLYVGGFIVGASNPKAIVFFTALFPQFINTSESLLIQYWVFAITFAVMEISWLTIYSYLGAKSSNWLLKEGRAKYFNRITGGVFISAGVFLSTSSKAST
ncbi:LysE family translocator [Oceanobacter sp. 3_MG-2023]|uniref:LysE family translocator n=1 Tax=Oceanobacter sp. 3_MG-2023 TaxID=3062622 RepID=UPI0027336EDD|nr:LysE family translocator [Oceanobacter sp. 3_MG-2023]MDP2504217.1 LysE family translocator [Oceanobacter sp. 3_MG-2023]